MAEKIILPDGYVVVPRRPTDEMIRAGHSVVVNLCDFSSDIPGKVFDAMVVLAPPPAGAAAPATAPETPLAKLARIDQELEAKDQGSIRASVPDEPQPAVREDARRYQALLDDPESARHLLSLLMQGKGTQADLRRMQDRIAASKAAAIAAERGETKA